MLQAVYVPYAVHRLGLTASAVGVTLGAYGFGMVCGALAAPFDRAAAPVWTRADDWSVLRIARFAGDGGDIVAPSFWLAMLSFFLLGAGPILWVVGSTTLRQAITPDGMMGRVSAINSTATYGARPLGALLGAAISGHWGMEACLVSAAGAFLVQALIIVVSPAARLEGVPA